MALNITEHVLLYCKENESKRCYLWRKLIKQFGLDTYNKILEFQPKEQLLVLFTGLEHILTNSFEIERCLTTVVKCFHYMLISNTDSPL